MQRGRVWWIQYREGGRRVRESLHTTNRKLAEELRLRREKEVVLRRFGAAPPPSPVVSVAPPPPASGAPLVVQAVPDLGGLTGGVGTVAVSNGVAFLMLTGSGGVPVAVALANGGALPVLAARAIAPPPDPSVPALPAPAAVAVEPERTLDQVRAEYEAWSAARKRAKTVMNDTKRLDEFFATVPGKGLREIRTADVERFLTKKATGGSKPATLARHREILHALWSWAKRQDYVPDNVVTAIPRVRIPESDPVFLSLPQIDELMAAVAGTKVEATVAIAVFAGLRREELCWLTWDDVEFDTSPPMLRVRAKTIGGESWQTKTKRDRRVPISPRLLEVLLRHREQRQRKDVPWLLPSPLGCRQDPDNLSREIRPVLKRAKLPWNLLTLRHTFGSQLARKGVSLLKIAKLMGNSPTIAARHYINLVPEEMANEVAF